MRTPRASAPRRAATLILSLLLALSLCPAVALAETGEGAEGNLASLQAAATSPVATSSEVVASGICGNHVTWELDSEGTLTISGIGDMDDDYGSLFDDDSNEYRSQIVSVEISEGVTSIGERAFSGCSSLTSVTIPSSVTSIGDRAFCNCESLADSDGFVVVGGVLYDYYGDGGDVAIPSGIASIGDYAFNGCSSLTSVTIPSGVTSMGNSSFYNCTSLTSVTVPSSVTSIGDYAFYGCSSLSSIAIPSGVTSSIGDCAFEGCKSLADADGFVVVGGVLFDYCGGGEDIAIPTGVTSIGSRAFFNCTSLSSVSIPSGVTSIGNAAFLGCSSLTSVAVPSSVTSIGTLAFEGCKSLADADGFVVVDGVLYDYCGDGGDVTIPSGVTSIGDYAFSYCFLMTSVTIPSGVTSVGDYAFEGCSRLSSVTIPSGVTSVGDYAFSYCTSLSSVSIPSGVASIGDCAFEGCSSLSSVSIPSSVISVGDEAFYGCESLADADGFVVVDGVLYDYCGDGGDVAIPSGVTSIGDYAFAYCSLTSVTSPSSLTSIGSLAFFNCSSLSSVSIPSGVTFVGDRAFYSCISLTSVEYEGDEAGWNDISFEKGNGWLFAAGLTCSDTATPDLSFTDVADSEEWYYDAVYYLAGLGVVNGYTDDDGNLTGEFGPLDGLTRAQLVTMLWRYACPEEAAAYGDDVQAAAKGATATADGSRLYGIEDGEFYTAAANWAVAEGVVTGYDNHDGTYDFEAEGAATFEQVATVLARMASGGESAGCSTAALSGSAYTDGLDVASWAASHVAWCLDEGLLSGYDNRDGTYTLKPGEDLYRARFATMLYKVVQAGAM